MTTKQRWATPVGFAAAVLAGCTGEDPPPCTEFEQVFVYADKDGDGFGADEPLGYKCAAEANEATNSVDCDDERAEVNPTAPDVCDDLDNNCNGAIDEENTKLPFYLDGDGDGFGSVDSGDKVISCVAPAGYVGVSGDCKDNNPDVNPGMHEVCNEGVDDDCDDAADDADGSVDLESRVRYYADVDLDGYGDPEHFIDACLPPPSGGVLDGTDCDDALDTVNPGAPEICDGEDNDCDLLKDDDDDTIDVETQHTYYDDADGDGFGDPATGYKTCHIAPNGIIDGTDCDDADPLYHAFQDWLTDADGDGWYGTVVVSACTDPGGGLVPEGGVDQDCNDASTSIYPFAPEVCDDGVDQDCNTRDQCASCQDWHQADAGLVTGVYQIEPTSGDVAQVYCDMSTDGGGWTLVNSSFSTAPKDAATATAYTDLQTLSPVFTHTALWDGLRPLSPLFDIRFACKQSALSAAMDVDLSFYDNAWYLEITADTLDRNTCFNEADGVGDDPVPPARRNNLTAAFLPLGDQWTAGYIESEDACTESDQFTVDFDDRGVAGDPMDGTDWGNDNGLEKCGTAKGETYYVFVREN